VSQEEWNITADIDSVLFRRPSRNSDFLSSGHWRLFNKHWATCQPNLQQANLCRWWSLLILVNSVKRNMFL